MKHPATQQVIAQGESRQQHMDDQESLIYVPDEAPEIGEILNSAILASEAGNDDPLRRAAEAEARGESNTELETVVDTIVGIKLLGIATEDEQLVSDAEEIFIGAIAGDSEKRAIAERGLKKMQKHSPGEKRRQTHIQFLHDEGYSDEQINEIFRIPEQLGYEHLSIVHATNHLPRKNISGERIIEDRFTGSGDARSTVHVALNAMVESNTFSADWSGHKFVIVAPMDKITEENGEPASLIAHDTWWETVPGRGLVLPEGTFIIRPGATKPIQILEESGEVRYKNQGVTVEDCQQLAELASDYELALVAGGLGVDLNLSYNHRAPGQLDSTSLDQYETVLSDRQREQVKNKLIKGIAENPGQTISMYTDLARRIAVRKALELQGRELIEPMTTMSSDFMSSDISDDFQRLRLDRNTSEGHHSESTVGKLEKLIVSFVKKGVFTGSKEVKRNITRDISENIDLIGRGTLHMYYRLGLI